mgnify:CR=1 FL=1
MGRSKSWDLLLQSVVVVGLVSTHRAQEEPEKEQNHSARRFCTSFEVMAINGAELATVVVSVAC